MRAKQLFRLPAFLLIASAWNFAPPSAPSADPGGAVQRATEHASVDWTGGVIEADGFGFVHADVHRNPARRMSMARSAAVADAYRNLAEAVRGVRVTSTTKVSDMEKASDKVTGAVRAFVVGAMPVAESYREEDGKTICEVTMRAPLGGAGGFSAHVLQYVAPLVRDQMPSEPASANLGLGHANWQAIQGSAKVVAWDHGIEARARAQERSNAITAAAMDAAMGGTPAATPAPTPAATPTPTPAPAAGQPAASVTGVLFDARDKEYAWNLYPVVKTEDGRAIYDLTAVAGNLDAGFFSPFAFSPEQGLDHKRTRANPLTISARGVDGNALVIANEDGERLLALNGEARVLEDGRVLFIISRPAEDQ